MTIQESLYLRLLQAGVLSERELERYQNLNELSKNRDVVLDRFSFEFSNDITARIDAFLASEHTQPSPDLSNLQAGELAQPSPDSPATDRQGSATDFQDLIPSDFIGCRVKVKEQQRCFGKPKFPNRVGTITKENELGSPNNRLFYVSLDATSRASDRIDCFWLDDLEFLPEQAGESDLPVIEQSPSKSPVQTLFDGLYDVASKVKAKVSKLTNSSSNPSPAPVQLTLFELLQPYAIDQYNKMQALLQAYLKDFAELKNSQSRLFKMLGAKSQKRLAELEDKLRILRRDLVFHFLCWELPQRLWVVV